MTITNDNGGQANTQVEADADQIDQDTEILDDTTEVDGQDDDENDDQDDQDDHQGGRRRNREAKFRHERNEARAERDALRGQLDTLHRQIVGDIAKAHGLDDVGLLEYRGHELSSFIAEDGTVNAAKIAEATAETVKHCNIAPPRKTPRPNAQQGAQGSLVSGHGLDDVINKALGR